METWLKTKGAILTPSALWRGDLCYRLPSPGTLEGSDLYLPVDHRWPVLTALPLFACFPKRRSPWTCEKCSPCHNWNAVLFLILPHSLKMRTSVPWARSSLKLPQWDPQPCREAAYFLNLPSPSFRPVSSFFTLGPCHVSSSPILSLRASSFLQE